MSTEIKRPTPLSDINDLRPLGSLELQVMQVVWRREEAGEETTTAGDCFRAMRTPERLIDYSTVISGFKRLKKNGWVNHVETIDTAFHYQSTVSRREVGRELLSWVVSEFFDGDPAKSVLADEGSGDDRSQTLRGLGASLV